MEIALLLVALAVAVLVGDVARATGSTSRRRCCSWSSARSASYPAVRAADPPRARGRAVRPAPAAALRRGAAHLARRLQRQPAPDPAAVGRRWSSSPPSASAGVVHALLPDLHWAMALAIGAVVAPPDAVAATAIGRRIGLPRRIVTILEGESLLNDATALVAAAHRPRRWPPARGLDGAGRRPRLRGRRGRRRAGRLRVLPGRRQGAARCVTDPVLDGAISLVVPFAAFVARRGDPRVRRDRRRGRRAAARPQGASASRPPQSRIAERLNWRTIAFLLENTVFLLIGLQAWWIIEGARRQRPRRRPDRRGLRGRRSSRCIVLRLVWVFPAALRARPRRRRDATATGRRGPTRSCSAGPGMRGVVTLAAAFVIPEDTEHREVLLLIAFTVVAGTLLHPGPDAAAGSPAGCKVPGPDPARGRPGPRDAAPAGVEGRAEGARPSRSTTTGTASST